MSTKPDVEEAAIVVVGDDDGRKKDQHDDHKDHQEADEAEVVKDGDDIPPAATKKKRKSSCLQYVFRKVLGIAWLLPPAITLLIGSRVSFRLAAIVSCAVSWVTFGAGWIRLKTNWCTRGDASTGATTASGSDGNDDDDDDDDDGDVDEFKNMIWPKTFDVVNPVAYGILLPVALIAGEEFCRLWMGLIVLGLFTVICIASLATARPLMRDWIGLGVDERLHPMMKDMIRSLTYVLAGIFAIMFASNLALAILGLEVGTTYVVLNFVIPYGALGIGIQMMYPMGRIMWEKSARLHYGEDWKAQLFPEEQEEQQQEAEDNAAEATTSLVDVEC